MMGEIRLSGTHGHWKEATASALLVLVTMLVYVPATRNGFIWDDEHYVTDNVTLRSLSGLQRIWLEPGVVPQYYPLVFSSFWFEYHLWGLNPAGYHWVNILLHTLSAWLFWKVLQRLEVPGGWLAALIFALHPVQVESVAWITERKNVLSGCFYWSALLCYLPFADGSVPARRRLACYVAALLLFLAALLSKTVTCSLPAVLVLLLWWRRGRVSRRDMLALVPFLMLGAALGMVTVWMEKHHVHAEGQEWALTPIERILVAGRALWFYAGKLVWPAALTFIYPRWQIDPGVWWQYLFPIAALLVVGVLWLARHRLGKGPLVAVLCFAGTLMPALGFFDVYPMRYSFVADHFQYLACAALIALAVASAMRALAHAPPPGAAIVGGTVVLALAALTWRQEPVYANLTSLWTDTLRKNPDCWMAHTNLGMVYLHAGKLDAARGQFLESMRLHPGDWKPIYNLGLVAVRQGQTRQGELRFREALALQAPDPEVATDLGMVLLQQERWREAADQFGAALHQDPRQWRAHYGLGVTHSRQQHFRDAVAEFRTAAQLNPAYADTYSQLGTALLHLGKTADAAQAFRQALRLNPADPSVRQNLSRIDKK